MTGMPPTLRRRILKAVEPPRATTRKARGVARELIRRLRALATARRLRVQPILVGSLAKDTHLRRPLDIDVFLLFPSATPREDLERHGVALGKKVLRRPMLRYAEHPYVHGSADGFSVDVVPAYKLRDASARMSAVDRTPFHTRFVRAHATPTHRREIRILKKFLQGTGCYGAETAIGGVSGYLTELLVLHYGTFAKTLGAIERWKPPVELSLQGTPRPMGGPLVCIDPVDPGRNAAAAVTQATFDRLQRAARAFNQGPRWEFFEPRPPQPLSRERLAALLARRPMLGVQAPAPRGDRETMRPQAHRLLAKVARALEQAGFSIEHRDAFLLDARTILLLLEHAPDRLPPTREHRGPRATDAEHAARFREKWTGHRDAVGAPRLRAGRWTVTVRLRRRTPRDLLMPEKDALLEGFDVPTGAARRLELLAGPILAASRPRRLPLTVFLRRLDPWES